VQLLDELSPHRLPLFGTNSNLLKNGEMPPEPWLVAIALVGRYLYEATGVSEIQSGNCHGLKSTTSLISLARPPKTCCSQLFSSRLNHLFFYN
jgi:hypothetical protein